ncbi:MAG: asparaginase [Fibrobacter sp.]|nr:asparaginase [Fibrobacter sp.]
MKKIAVLATGGTIAGVGDVGKDLGYRSGTLSVESILSSAGDFLGAMDVELLPEQVCNVNSDDITDKIWIALSRRVNELQKDSSVSGIVITHGTDTMDETAYFLDLTVEKVKPVVLTGSMRPSTAKEPDGPKNLSDAIKVASSDFKCDSVLVCFGGYVYEASDMQKLSANALNPMGVHSAGEGFVGTVENFMGIRGDRTKILCKKRSGNLNSDSSVPLFDVSQVESLPRVNVLYFAVDSNPSLLEYAAKISDGIVIAGAGSGEFSQKWGEALRAVQVPVVISSRIGQGLVTVNETLAPRGISAGVLPPQKAAVLLRLSLTRISSMAELRRIFLAQMQ